MLLLCFQVGFITGVPASLRVNGAAIEAAEINFLCVHKKLRAKRLTPLLIKEVTRRVNLTGVWHAAFTAGVVIPKPAATCRYYHRSLNPKKLIEVGFSSLNARSTMTRTIKLNKLPDVAQTPGAALLPLILSKRAAAHCCKCCSCSDVAFCKCGMHVAQTVMQRNHHVASHAVTVI